MVAPPAAALLYNSSFLVLTTRLSGLPNQYPSNHQQAPVSKIDAQIRRFLIFNRTTFGNRQDQATHLGLEQDPGVLNLAPREELPTATRGWQQGAGNLARSGNISLTALGQTLRQRQRGGAGPGNSHRAKANFPGKLLGFL